MIVINKNEFETSKRKYTKIMLEDVFIYPTDSIYGIGCDATNEKLVEKIRELKANNTQPFSIIAPSKEWVYENCVVSKKDKKYVENLGNLIKINNQDHRFTLILKLKNKNTLAKNVVPGKDSIGVRIPNHWFSEIINTINVPIITTSANKTGSNFMTKIDDLESSIKNNVAFILYEGEKKGNPSTIINLTHEDDEVKIIER